MISASAGVSLRVGIKVCVQRIQGADCDGQAAERKVRSVSLRTREENGDDVEVVLTDQESFI